MNIIIDTWVQDDCTLGRLTCEDFRCFTLELPWRDNLSGISCVPDGTYKAKFYLSPSKGPTLLLENVPGRTYIEIHAGNFTYQIKGCILVGDGIKYIDRDTIPDVSNSKTTLGKLLALVGEDELTVTINRKF